MDRDYVPFKDYLSLSSVAWNQVKDLRCLIPPQCGSNMYEEEFLLNDNLLPRPSYDSLDEVRANSLDDFKRNGIDKDLDDIDKYQHQIREVRALAPVNHHPDTAHFRQLNKSKRKSKKSCAFCKNNGELPSLYNSHVLKDSDGKVLCPVLRKYTCPTCGENGDSAHTIRYCPQNTTGASAGLLIFLNSSRDSAGRLKVNK